jgi:hypothetical protein
LAPGRRLDLAPVATLAGAVASIAAFAHNTFQAPLLGHAQQRQAVEAKLHSSGGLVVRRSQDPREVILEYEVHGRIVATGVPYDNRFISVSIL